MQAMAGSPEDMHVRSSSNVGATASGRRTVSLFLPALPSCCRHARRLHAASVALRRCSTRCQAEGSGIVRHGSPEEAELSSLMARLREDDVEYFDLKVPCSGCPDLVWWRQQWRRICSASPMLLSVYSWLPT